jgi:hypothetical protein
MMHHMITGKSFEYICAAAAATGRLHRFVRKLVEFNDSRAPGSGVLFDLSSLLLARILLTYGDGYLLGRSCEAMCLENPVFRIWRSPAVDLLASASQSRPSSGASNRDAPSQSLDPSASQAPLAEQSTKESMDTSSPHATGVSAGDVQSVPDVQPACLADDSYGQDDVKDVNVTSDAAPSSDTGVDKEGEAPVKPQNKELDDNKRESEDPGSVGGTSDCGKDAVTGAADLSINMSAMSQGPDSLEEPMDESATPKELCEEVSGSGGDTNAPATTIKAESASGTLPVEKTDRSFPDCHEAMTTGTLAARLLEALLSNDDTWKERCLALIRCAPDGDSIDDEQLGGDDMNGSDWQRKLLLHIPALTALMLRRIRPPVYGGQRTTRYNSWSSSTGGSVSGGGTVVGLGNGDEDVGHGSPLGLCSLSSIQQHGVRTRPPLTRECVKTVLRQLASAACSFIVVVAHSISYLDTCPERVDALATLSMFVLDFISAQSSSSSGLPSAFSTPDRRKQYVDRFSFMSLMVRRILEPLAFRAPALPPVIPGPILLLPDPASLPPVASPEAYKIVWEDSILHGWIRPVSIAILKKQLSFPDGPSLFVNTWLPEYIGLNNRESYGLLIAVLMLKPAPTAYLMACELTKLMALEARNRYSRTPGLIVVYLLCQIAVFFGHERAGCVGEGQAEAGGQWKQPPVDCGDGEVRDKTGADAQITSSGPATSSGGTAGCDTINAIKRMRLDNDEQIFDTPKLADFIISQLNGMIGEREGVTYLVHLVGQFMTLWAEHSDLLGDFHVPHHLIRKLVYNDPYDLPASHMLTFYDLSNATDRHHAIQNICLMKKLGEVL